MNYCFQKKEKFLKIFIMKDEKIEELNKKVDYDDLKFLFKSSGEESSFDKSEDPAIFLNDIKTGDISLEEAKNLQQDYETYLKKIRKGNKSAEQKKALTNINILFNARNNVIKFIEDYGSMILEAKRLGKQGT